MSLSDHLAKWYLLWYPFVFLLNLRSSMVSSIIHIIYLKSVVFKVLWFRSLYPHVYVLIQIALLTLLYSLEFHWIISAGRRMVSGL